MIVSQTGGAGNDNPGATAPAVSPASIGRLRKRSQYLRVAKGARFHTGGFSLQSAPAESGPPGQDAPVARFGFTVTRKAGTAVERNRIRRRLRAALRLAPELASKPGHDYVVLARREALHLSFGSLVRDLQTAVVRIGAKAGRKPPK